MRVLWGQPRDPKESRSVGWGDKGAPDRAGVEGAGSPWSGARTVRRRGKSCDTGTGSPPVRAPKATPFSPPPEEEPRSFRTTVGQVYGLAGSTQSESR